jgi:threonine aldolase
MFCLSKGLGAPVGSMLVGDRDTIAEARRVRKMFGGGMRQVGVLAAAGLVALDEVLPRLGDDNRRAKQLARRLAELPGVVLDPALVETNIVFLALSSESPVTAGELARRLAAEGVLVHALGATSVRMVTHHHITDADVESAARAVRRVLAG